ncbi:Putative bacteriophage tail protein [Magnetospirillum sp. XM-1]|uniref:YmfQ family protein n=1 Tax=Magnetospirillum sp. XM-1 TaxID=1663591 RepID=UPI00073E0111|nr:putative phage tail protein [Magnetospirillum sp. XM-1]CUW41150.1 Putative bacteriophage tail protein [Magnetospirillum sp. XM-1]
MGGRATYQDYGATLRALLPTGEAWPRMPGLLRDDLLDALGETFARIHNRALDLIEEADPRTAVLLLPEWEQALGLPDECTGQAETVAERQRRAHAKLIAVGGDTFEYFTGVAAALGYAITIAEHPAATCESHCESPLDPDDLVVGGVSMPWCFVIDIGAPTETIHELDCVAGGCDEPLRIWGNQLLECVMRREFRRRRTTRHLFLRFAYGDA